MKKVYVCVSSQKTQEETISVARACCKWVRKEMMLPLADQYLFQNDGINVAHVKDLDEMHEYLVDREYRRALMKLCDEVWVFLTKEPDEQVVVDVSIAQELGLDVQIVRKGEKKCSFYTM